MSSTVAHAGKVPASCRIPCTLHNPGRIHGEPAEGLLEWRAACLTGSACSSAWRCCRSRCSRFLPLVSSGQQKNLGSKIERKKDQIAWRKGRERVLSSDVAGFTRRINALQGDITVLQTKQVRLQASLDRKRAELARIQEDLRRERLRLARLRARLAEARAALSKRLVELYKADQPDLVTVVLESDGFADLLERTEFMQRVSHQDARIIDIVVEAKAEATATAKRLDRLEKRAKVVADADRGRGQPGHRRQGPARRPPRPLRRRARGQKSALLAKTRDDRHDARGRPARARGRAGARCSPRCRPPPPAAARRPPARSSRARAA